MAHPQLFYKKGFTTAEHTYTHTYLFQTEYFSIINLFPYYHKQYCIFWISSSQLHNPAHTQEHTAHGTSYYNECHCSCSLLTFPFFNCVFSLLQLCIVNLRWRLQRKVSLHVTHYTAGKTKNYFLCQLLPSSGSLFPTSLIYIHFTSPEFRFYHPLICCLKASAKNELL